MGETYSELLALLPTSDREDHAQTGAKTETIEHRQPAGDTVGEWKQDYQALEAGTRRLHPSRKFITERRERENVPREVPRLRESLAQNTIKMFGWFHHA